MTVLSNEQYLIFLAVLCCYSMPPNQTSCNLGMLLNYRASSIANVLLIHFVCFVTGQLYTRETSKNWKLAGSDGSSQLTIKEPLANMVLLDYVSSEKWQDVVDFDDHLDDISKYDTQSPSFEYCIINHEKKEAKVIF